MSAVMIAVTKELPDPPEPRVGLVFPERPVNPVLPEMKVRRVLRAPPEPKVLPVLRAPKVDPALPERQVLKARPVLRVLKVDPEAANVFQRMDKHMKPSTTNQIKGKLHEISGNFKRKPERSRTTPS